MDREAWLQWHHNGRPVLAPGPLATQHIMEHHGLCVVDVDALRRELGSEHIGKRVPVHPILHKDVIVLSNAEVVVRSGRVVEAVSRWASRNGAEVVVPLVDLQQRVALEEFVLAGF